MSVFIDPDRVDELATSTARAADRLEVLATAVGGASTRAGLSTTAALDLIEVSEELDLGARALRIKAQIVRQQLGAPAAIGWLGRFVAGPHPTDNPILQFLFRAWAQHASGLSSPALSAAAAGLRAELATGATGEVAGPEVVEMYQQLAMAAAGIVDGWRPHLGVPANDHAAQSGWDYYAELFAASPSQFLWAGMAHAVAPALYGAFQDVHVLGNALNDGLSIEDVVTLLIDALASVPGIDHVIAPVLDPLIQPLADLDTDFVLDDLRFVEQTLIAMQEAVFDDLAWQHLAYLDGGLGLLDELVPHAVPADEVAHVLHAWADIDTGDQALVAAGNVALIWREQHLVLQPFYDELWDQGLVTQALLTILSIVSAAPLPGASSFLVAEILEAITATSPTVSDAVPLPELPWIDLPGPGLGDVPLVGRPIEVIIPTDFEPTANLADFDDRWEYITDELWPTFTDGAADPDGAIATILSTPVADLAGDHRLLPDDGPFEYRPGD